MNAAGLWDWAWWTGGAVLAAAGLIVLLWATVWDRSRGRRRCPRCWYDMRGVPGLVCPECGGAARSERRLFRTRRRWGWGAAGVAAVLAGHAAWCGPRVRDEGWRWGFVPTTALLALTWWHDPAPHQGFRPHPDKTTIPLRHRAWAHLWDRHRSGWMWGVHHRAWVHRRVLPRLLETPGRWPEGHPLVVRVAWDRGEFGALGFVFKITPRFAGATPVVDHSASLGLRLPFEGRDLDSFALRPSFHEVGVPPAGTRGVVFDVEVYSLNAAGDAWVRTWRTSTTRRIAVGGRPEEMRPAVRGPEADAAVRSFYRWDLSGSLWRLGTSGLEDLPAPLRGTTLGYRVEVMHGDEVVAHVRHWFMSFDEPPHSRTAGQWRLEGDLGRLKAADPADPAWRIRLTGDPLMALRDFKGERWWDGVIETPLGGDE